LFKAQICGLFVKIDTNFVPGDHWALRAHVAASASLSDVSHGLCV